MHAQTKASLVAAGLYFIVANPVTYDLVQALLGRVVTVKEAGGATQLGTGIHAAVFGLLTYLIMRMATKAKPYDTL